MPGSPGRKNCPLPTDLSFTALTAYRNDGTTRGRQFSACGYPGRRAGCRLVAEAEAKSDDPIISAGTLQEVILVLGKFSRTTDVDPFELAFTLARNVIDQGLRIMPVDSGLAALGAAGSLMFQASRAKLNFGDGSTYALALSMNAPMLCKGDDFANTGTAVLRPPEI